MQNATFSRKLTIYASVLISATFATVDTYPGDLCCRVYADPNYSGDTEDVCYDYHTYGADGEHFVKLGSSLANRVSSWWCGKNIAYDFCNDGESGCYQSGAGNARSP